MVCTRDIKTIKNILDDKQGDIKQKYKDFINKILLVLLNEEAYKYKNITILGILDVIITIYKNNEFVKCVPKYKNKLGEPIDEMLHNIFNNNDIETLEEIYDKYKDRRWI